jgi:hypothetical protein
LLQLTILAALKLTRANAQNIIFVAKIWEKKLNIINAEIWENNAEIWSFPAQAIHMLLKIPATRTPQGALKFVALIIKILSCNKKYFFHGLRSKLPQLFYFLAFALFCFFFFLLYMGIYTVCFVCLWRWRGMRPQSKEYPTHHAEGLVNPKVG